MVRRDRQALHRKVGEALEGLRADRLDDVAATLAHHFERVSDPGLRQSFVQLPNIHAVLE